MNQVLLVLWKVEFQMYSQEVRRLFKYSLDNSKYFKEDSLCMIVSQSINLTGFALFSWIWIYAINDANNFSKDSKEIFSIDIYY